MVTAGPMLNAPMYVAVQLSAGRRGWNYLLRLFWFHTTIFSRRYWARRVASYALPILWRRNRLADAVQQGMSKYARWNTAHAD